MKLDASRSILYAKIDYLNQCAIIRERTANAVRSRPNKKGRAKKKRKKTQKKDTSPSHKESSGSSNGHPPSGINHSDVFRSWDHNHAIGVMKKLGKVGPLQQAGLHGKVHVAGAKVLFVAVTEGAYQSTPPPLPCAHVLLPSSRPSPCALLYRST